LAQMDYQKQFEQMMAVARRAQSKLINESHQVVSICIIAATVVFPLVEGVLATNIVKVPPGGWLIIIVIHGIAAFISIRGSTSLREIVDLTDLQKIEEAYQSLNEGTTMQVRNLTQAAAWTTAVAFSLAWLRLILNSSPPRNLEEDIENILGPFYVLREAALGFRTGDAWHNLSH
jgi:K+ transporter